MTNNIPNIHLPYQIRSRHVELDSDSDASIEHVVKQIINEGPDPEQIEKLQSAYAKQRKKYNEELVSIFVESVSTIPEYATACLLAGEVHGYMFQHVIVQVEDGACFRQSWTNGVTIEATSSIQRIGGNLDLRKELLLLRNGTWTFRNAEAVNHIIDQKSGIEGRTASLFIAVGTDVEWLTCSRLLLRGEYPNNPLNRILLAVEDLEGKVLLV